MALKIDPKKCPQNHQCPMIKICPVGAITQNSTELPIIDDNLCTECGKCVKLCPLMAVKK